MNLIFLDFHNSHEEDDDEEDANDEELTEVLEKTEKDEILAKNAEVSHRYSWLVANQLVIA